MSTCPLVLGRRTRAIPATAGGHSLKNPLKYAHDGNWTRLATILEIIWSKFAKMSGLGRGSRVGFSEELAETNLGQETIVGEIKLFFVFAAGISA